MAEKRIYIQFTELPREIVMNHESIILQDEKASKVPLL
jgi:hypothetical protein